MVGRTSGTGGTLGFRLQAGLGTYLSIELLVALTVILISAILPSACSNTREYDSMVGPHNHSAPYMGS